MGARNHSVARNNVFIFHRLDKDFQLKMPHPTADSVTSGEHTQQQLTTTAFTLQCVVGEVDMPTKNQSGRIRNFHESS